VTREILRAMPQPGFQFEEAEHRGVLSAPGLRLSFSRVGDRWTHVLEVGDGDGALAVASAVEGDPDRDDPARVVSPSYQEIRPHAFDGGVRALLTGQSSPHHFSAVVTARRDGEGVAVEFDVADRCRRPVAALAGTYLVRLGSGALVDASPGRIVWGGDVLGSGRLEFSAEGPGSVSLGEAGRRAARVQAIALVVPITFTHRFVYRWRWTPGVLMPPDESSPKIL
jgi:hypothetical protein